MQPLSAFAVEARRAVRGVLCDIDDTVTSDGRLTAAAYGALERLRTAGLVVVPITGRPAGWCDHIARMWPVDAVVGENGAFYFRYDHAARTMRRQFIDTPPIRAQHRAALTAIAAEILAAVPGAAIAADQPYRETDLAIDFCEDVPRLPADAVARIVATMEGHGLTVKVSSIHVNGWFGSYDKLTTARLLLKQEFGDDDAGVAHRYGYVGDSPNDEPMFGFFECAVGVANVADFADRMRNLPRYVTRCRGGAGFAEFADALVRAKAGS